MSEKWERAEFIEKIKDVDGFSDKLAERFVDNFKYFKKFFKEINEIYTSRSSLWERDISPTGFSWLVGDDGAGKYLQLCISTR